MQRDVDFPPELDVGEPVGLQVELPAEVAGYAERPDRVPDAQAFDGNVVVTIEIQGGDGLALAAGVVVGAADRDDAVQIAAEMDRL